MYFTIQQHISFLLNILSYFNHMVIVRVWGLHDDPTLLVKVVGAGSLTSLVALGLELLLFGELTSLALELFLAHDVGMHFYEA
jgi:hypothetical protein